MVVMSTLTVIFFFQAEDGIRDLTVTGVQTCALPISSPRPRSVRDAWHRPSARRTSRRGGPPSDPAQARRLAGRARARAAACAGRGARSEERRVGEEGRSRWAPHHLKKKKNIYMKVEG